MTSADVDIHEVRADCTDIDIYANITAGHSRKVCAAVFFHHLFISYLD